MLPASFRLWLAVPESHGQYPTLLRSTVSPLLAHPQIGDGTRRVQIGIISRTPHSFFVFASARPAELDGDSTEYSLATRRLRLNCQRRNQVHPSSRPRATGSKGQKRPDQPGLFASVLAYLEYRPGHPIQEFLIVLEHRPATRRAALDRPQSGSQSRKGSKVCVGCLIGPHTCG